MDLFAKNFSFGNQELSSEYALVAFDDPGTAKETALQTTTNKSSITPYRSQVSLYGVQYEDVIKFEVSIIRCDQDTFKTEEIDTFYSWILSPITYQPFTITDYPDTNYHQGIVYYAICIGYEEFRIGTQVKGLKFYFECDAPYGYAPTETTNFSSTASTTIKINNTSDELVDYYPLIKIKSNATGKVTLKTDKYPSEVMELQVLQDQELTIDNESGTITDNMELFSFEDDFNLTWIHLAPGENTITITGNVTGSIECTYIRKRGV